MVVGMHWSSTMGDDQTVFIAVFNAGWFVESLWTQSLVIHMIRTPQVPFLQSRASLVVLCSTTIAIAVGTVIPYTPLGSILGMSSLPAVFFLGLIATIAAYMVLVTIVKKNYVKKYGELL